MNLGDIVYLRVATERSPGMITGILIRPTGKSYWVSWCDATETLHYDIELTSEFVPEYAQESESE